MATREVLLGMSNLAFVGLSESWLLMDCGHHHWAMLSESIGQPLGELKDSNGNRIYASFVSYSIRGSLDWMEEGERIQIRSRQRQLSSKRFHSIHTLCALGGREVRVEMISIYLRRQHAKSYRGFYNAAAELSVGDYLYRPVPPTDFNGARLLYFAKYHEIVDRAEWELSGDRNPLSATNEREVFYFANLDPGDRVLP